MLNLCKNVWRKDIQSKYVKIDYIELYEYAINVGLNTLGSVAGEKLGNKFGDKANKFLEDGVKNIPFGVSRMNKVLYPTVKGVANEIINQINDWRKDW